MIVGAVSMLMFLNVLPSVAAAADQTKADSPKGPDLGIAPLIIKEDQVKNTKGYFHIGLEPGDSKKFGFKLENTTDEVMFVDAEVLNSLSSAYSSMNYTTEEESSQSKFLSDEYVFKDYMSEDQLVKLKPNEIKEIEFELDLPDNIDEGQLLGGVSFSKAEVEEENEEKDKEDTDSKVSFSIKEKYTVAILVDLPNEVESEINLNDLEISGKGRPHIIASIENINPIITDDITAEYEVTRKGDTEPLFTNDQKMFSLAPVTDVSYVFPWDYEEFETGTYNVNLKILQEKNESKTILAEMNKDIKVSRDEVKKVVELPDENVQIVEKGISKTMYLFIGLLILLIGYIAYKMGRRSQENTKKEDIEETKTTYDEKEEENEEEEESSENK